MEALTERLSHLDPDVEGVIRIVAFYDTLMRRRVDLSTLARVSAGLAECAAGIRLHGTGQVVRFLPDGKPAVGSLGSATTMAPITLDDEEVGVVWLERAGPPGPLDEALLDRLAIAAATAMERYGPASSTMADPALVELVISTVCDEAARARALRLLGFAAGQRVQVIAVRSQMPLDRLGGVVCPGRPVKAALLGEIGVMLATNIVPARFEAGIRAGIGVADCPHRCWQQARTALRFTTEREPVIRYDELGALALLAEVPDTVSRTNTDVAAIIGLDGAADDLETLEAYCATGSLRQAADILHLHHTSVARRLHHIEKILGIELTQPAGLMRARIALTARRLLD
jgi:hypothetical protein